MYNIDLNNEIDTLFNILLHHIDKYNMNIFVPTYSNGKHEMKCRKILDETDFDAFYDFCLNETYDVCEKHYNDSNYLNFVPITRKSIEIMEINKTIHDINKHKQTKETIFWSSFKNNESNDLINNCQKSINEYNEFINKLWNIILNYISSSNTIILNKLLNYNIYTKNEKLYSFFHSLNKFKQINSVHNLLINQKHINC